MSVNLEVSYIGIGSELIQKECESIDTLVSNGANYLDIQQFLIKFIELFTRNAKEKCRSTCSGVKLMITVRCWCCCHWWPTIGKGQRIVIALFFPPLSQHVFLFYCCAWRKLKWLRCVSVLIQFLSRSQENDKYGRLI